jgi:putative nucleotidyltransferase with HDIG domain
MNPKFRKVSKNNKDNRRPRRRSNLPRLWRDYLSKILLGLMVAVAISFLFPKQVLHYAANVPVFGEVATEEVVAPFDFYILKDPAELEAEKKRALEDLVPALKMETDKKTAVLEGFRAFTNEVERLQASDTTMEEEIAQLKESFPDLREDDLRAILGNVHVGPATDFVSFWLDSLLEVGIIQSSSELPETKGGKFEVHNGARPRLVLREKIPDLDGARGLLERKISALPGTTSGFRRAILTVVFSLLEPNLFYDREETDRRRDQVLASVKEYAGVVSRGEVIISAGQIVGAEAAAKLRSLMQTKARLESPSLLRAIFPFAGRVLLISFPIFFLGLFLRFFKPPVFDRFSNLLLMSFLLLALSAAVYSLSFSEVLSKYLVPVAIASMLLTILFDLEVGIVSTLFFSLVVGELYRFDLELVVISALAGTVAAFSVREVRHRSNFYRPILYTSLAYVVFIYVMESFKLKTPMEILPQCGYGLANGFLSPILTIGLLPLFETVFGLTTDITLLELSDLNRPLLKRMALEAPGTYHHSIMMGTLAEAAAKEIGANSLLARVGAYYHDIGKMLKPEYFVENLMGSKNKHEKLTPSMSALILESHVKEGRELAKKAKLPTLIVDFIEQHHGTSLMTYFYRKAIDQGAEPAEIESDFRYPGPRPTFKESAIVMLADSLEAASRTLEDPSPARIRSLVTKIIGDKFQSGELDDSTLSFKEMHTVQESFIQVLNALFHHRIEYPDEKEEETTEENVKKASRV